MTTIHQRLADIVEHRANVFEIVLPYKRAANVYRYRSAFFAEDMVNTRLLETASLRGLLPAQWITNGIMFEALNMVLSFSAWQRLRDEQGLSTAKAKN